MWTALMSDSSIDRVNEVEKKQSGLTFEWLPHYGD